MSRWLQGSEAKTLVFGNHVATYLESHKRVEVKT